MLRRCLPARQPDAALADIGLVALWQRRDEIVGVGLLGGGYDFGKTGLRLP